MSEITIQQRLEIQDTFELLFHIPTRVLDFRNPITTYGELHSNTNPTACAKLGYVDFAIYDRNKRQLGVADQHGYVSRGKAFRIDLRVIDRNRREFTISAFNPYQWVSLDYKTGIFTSKIPLRTAVNLSISTKVTDDGRVFINANDWIDAEYVGKLVPVYPAVRKKIKGPELSKEIDKIYSTDIDMAANMLLAISDIAKDDFFEELGITPFEMLQAVHSPLTPDEFDDGLAAAKKFSVMQVMRKAEKIKGRPQSPLSVLNSVPVDFEGIKLTVDQVTAIAEIREDLLNGRPMRRLLTGDVGTGKTFPMIAIAVGVWRYYKLQGQHRNIAILLPNEPLVRQVAANIAKFCPDVDVELVLSKAKKKYNPKSILIGTSAILNLPDYTAHLAIVDEQHKFSREQRERLAAPHTNMLEASATAIPRSTALIQFGGMEISYLRQCPVEKHFHTHIIQEDERVKMYHTIKKAMEAGKRIMIVYPLVEGNEDDVLSATTGYEAWAKLHPGKVFLLHGKMKPEDKQPVIDSYKNTQSGLLVTTSIVEVGLDVTDVAVMVVVKPQRYGLNQLHQMRGRLARNGGHAYMFLYPSEDISEETYERLDALTKTTDGFEIAEIDMNQRGFGDIAEDSEDQSGSSSYTLVNVKLTINDFVGRGIKPKF